MKRFGYPPFCMRLFSSTKFVEMRLARCKAPVMQFRFQFLGTWEFQYMGNLPGFLYTRRLNFPSLYSNAVSRKWSGFSSQVNWIFGGYVLRAASNGSGFFAFFGKKIVDITVVEGGNEVVEHVFLKFCHKNICKNWGERVSHTTPINLFTQIVIETENSVFGNVRCLSTASDSWPEIWPCHNSKCHRYCRTMCSLRLLLISQ